MDCDSRGSAQRRRGPGVSGGVLGMGARASIRGGHGMMLRRGGRRHRIRRSARHGPARDDREVLLVVDGGLWIEALLRAHVAQGRIAGGLEEARGVGVRPRVIADEMQVLPGRGRDAEGLLHQAVGLVPVAIRAVVRTLSPVLVAATRRVGRLPRALRLRRHRGAAPLALHLTIREKTARDAAGAP